MLNQQMHESQGQLAIRRIQHEAWEQGHAAACGYDLREPLDREEWDELFPERENPYSDEAWVRTTGRV